MLFRRTLRQSRCRLGNLGFPLNGGTIRSVLSYGNSRRIPAVTHKSINSGYRGFNSGYTFPVSASAPLGTNVVVGQTKPKTCQPRFLGPF